MPAGLDVKQDFLRDAKAKTAPLKKHEFYNGIKKLNNLTYL